MLTRSLFIACFATMSAALLDAGDRPVTPAGKSGRSVTIAPHGMVATSQPLAAQVGLEVLKKGGNAVDAAIATNAALGLMEPMSCGIGGDLYAIVWDAKTQKLYGLNASGRSPYKADARVLRRQGAEGDPRHRAAVAGRCRAASMAGTNCTSKFGTLPLDGHCSSRRIDYAEEASPSPRSSPATGAGRDAAAADPGMRADVPDPDGDAATAASRRRLQEPEPGAVATAPSPRAAATPSTRGRSPRRSSPSPTRSAACSR